MPSDIWKLNWQDFAKGAIVAILTAIVSYLGNLTTLTSFDGGQMFQFAVAAFLAYLGKNLVTTKDGKFLGSI